MGVVLSDGRDDISTLTPFS